MTADEVRVRIKSAVHRFDTTSLELAFDLAMVAGERAYRQWNFLNFADWIKRDVGLSVSWAYKLAGIGRCFWREKDFLLGRTADTPTLHQLAEAVSAIERGEMSVEAVLAGAECPVASEGLRSVKAIPTSLKAIMEWAWHLARWDLCKVDPSETELWEAVLSTYLLEMRERVAASGELEHTTSDGIHLAWTLEDVCTGKVRCEGCGSWDRSSLDPHHRVRRSAESHQVDPAGIALLCRECHRRTHATQGGAGEAVEGRDELRE